MRDLIVLCPYQLALIFRNSQMEVCLNYCSQTEEITTIFWDVRTVVKSVS